MDKKNNSPIAMDSGVADVNAIDEVIAEVFADSEHDPADVLAALNLIAKQKLVKEIALRGVPLVGSALDVDDVDDLDPMASEEQVQADQGPGTPGRVVLEFSTRRSGKMTRVPSRLVAFRLPQGAAGRASGLSTTNASDDQFVIEVDSSGSIQRVSLPKIFEPRGQRDGEKVIRRDDYKSLQLRLHGGRGDQVWALPLGEAPNPGSEIRSSQVGRPTLDAGPRLKSLDAGATPATPARKKLRDTGYRIPDNLALSLLAWSSDPRHK